MSAITRPVMRYHGGKFRLAPWIISHFPVHRVYVEPFGGGASVLMRKPRVYAEIYNDLDGEVVNVFSVLRDRGAELVELLRLTPFSRAEFELSYQRSDDAVEQARRTIARSFMGFGSASVTGESSGFRANSNRSGTTPAHDWANLADAMPALIERLRGVVIENRDALRVSQHHDTDDTLHYFDPPYVHSTRSPKVRGTGTEGRATGKAYRYEMTDEDHRALVSALDDFKGMVIVSGYESSLYEELFAGRGWATAKRRAMADGARERTEVLWMNPACSYALARSRWTLFGEAA
jgi:DNA adenine methylase